jgi:anti-sigma B factor antagonist
MMPPSRSHPESSNVIAIATSEAGLAGSSRPPLATKLPEGPPGFCLYSEPEHRMTTLDASAPAKTTTTVRLSGEIDIFTSKALREQLMSLLASSRGVLILDLSDLLFCDASGLAILVGVQRRARSMGITLALAAPSPYMSDLLRSTGLGRAIPVLA